MKVIVNIGINESESEERWVELEIGENGIVFSSEDCDSIEVIRRLIIFVPRRFLKYELVYAGYSIAEKTVMLYNNTTSTIKVHPTTLRWEKVAK